MRRYFVAGALLFVAGLGTFFAIGGGVGQGSSVGRIQRAPRYGGRGWPAAAPTPTLFQFANSAGDGMGTECACATITGKGGEAVTDSRSQAAWCIKTDFTYVKCAVNKARVMTGRMDETWLGVIAEPQIQNLVQSPRNLAAADWTKSNVTCTHTATGVDGSANTGSICTATAGNGTVTQALTRGSTSSTTSWHVRRRTGTGSVLITRDNFTTPIDIGPWLTSSWKRVVSDDAAGCAGGRCIIIPEATTTMANPTIGIQLVTSGDAIDVDLVQDEALGHATTPQDTDGTNLGFRTADTLFMTIPSFSTAAGFSFAGTAVVPQNASSNVFFELDQDGNNYAAQYANGGSNNVNYIVAGAGPTATATGTGFGPLPIRFAGAWDGVSVVTARYQGVTATTTSAKGALNMVKFYLGSSGASATAADAVVRDGCLDTSQSRCTTSISTHATKKVAIIGDSILAGSSVGYKPVTYIPYHLGTDYDVVNSTVGSTTCGDMRTRWTNTVKATAPTHLIIMCGVNDLALAGRTVDDAWTDLKFILDDARDAGVTVRPVLTLNCLNAVGCGSTQAADINDLRGRESAYCADAGVTCSDPASIMQDGGVMITKYDLGDGKHPGELGSRVFSAYIYQTYAP